MSDPLNCPLTRVYVHVLSTRERGRLWKIPFGKCADSDAGANIKVFSVPEKRKAFTLP